MSRTAKVRNWTEESVWPWLAECSRRLCCVEFDRRALDRVAVPLLVQILRASSVNAVSMRR